MYVQDYTDKKWTDVPHEMRHCSASKRSTGEDYLKRYVFGLCRDTGATVLHEWIGRRGAITVQYRDGRRHTAEVRENDATEFAKGLCRGYRLAREVRYATPWAPIETVPASSLDLPQ